MTWKSSGRRLTQLYMCCLQHPCLFLSTNKLYFQSQRISISVAIMIGHFLYWVHTLLFNKNGLKTGCGSMMTIFLEAERKRVGRASWKSQYLPGGEKWYHVFYVRGQGRWQCRYGGQPAAYGRMPRGMCIPESKSCPGGHRRCLTKRTKPSPE